MALTDRPEVELNEFQREKVGYETDVRYQSILSMLDNLEMPLLQAIKTKLDALVAGNQGS